MALHFELIARCPVAAPAARLLSEKLPLAPLLLQINLPQKKSDYDQERFMGTIQKKKNTKLRGTLKQNAKSCETRERKERTLPTHYIFIRR